MRTAIPTGKHEMSANSMTCTQLAKLGMRLVKYSIIKLVPIETYHFILPVVQPSTGKTLQLER